MKILHVVEAWHGGIASYVDALIRAQMGQGHQVVLAADSQMLAADPRDLPCAIDSYPASRNPARFPAVRATLAIILARHAPDIVHVHSTFPGVYTRFPHALHPRIIYTPHGWSFLKKDSPAWVRWGYGRVERWLASRARVVMCMSFEELNRARALGIDPDRLTMIHTGINDCFAEAINSNQAAGVQGDRGLNIGFFGRLDYQKGADLLPALADRLATDSTLHVFGSEVRGRRPLQPHPRIRRYGWVAHEALAAHMVSMDVIIIPSRWEGFSLTALEALRAGVPIIVSNLTSLSEVVVHGYNGLIMHDFSAEHLAGLLVGLSIQDCRRMGHNARRVFQEAFTFDRFHRQVMALYQAVLSD
ncbi:MAG: glycosyltransferase [Castellaniella sp.]|uniref:glycosyltransferase n=1 Tax=Castellaniella sp. TaxID=1955812 RepID=UPI002A358B72|nr:glycosyltransferase [Castellaniella sp.]MDY0309058.1 glycosyltransferase [Castellaniella sp.]